MMPAHDQARMRRRGTAAKWSDVESQYRAYHDYVSSLCAGWIGDRGEAEDLAQEVFIRALASPPRSCTSSWLFKVARSVSIDHVRRKARQQLVPVEEVEGFLSPVAADFDGKETGEVRGALVRALARLSKRDRQIALLRIRDQMSYSEIARALRTTPHSARTSVWRARRAVSTELDGAHGLEMSQFPR
jgi:RNA polymerase sigma-70 factor, ECF subfamily